jgi:hypothetical protein
MGIHDMTKDSLNLQQQKSLVKLCMPAELNVKNYCKE